MKLTQRIGVAALGCLLIAGCAQQGPKAMKVLPPPAAPPPVPAVRLEPIDPALRQQAEREIRAATMSSDPRLRANAMESAQIGIGPGSRDILVAGLGDKEWIVRFSSLMAIGTLQLTDLHDRVLALANDSSRQVQVASRYALHRLGDHRLSQDLVRFATDPDPRVRANVAMALGLLGEKSAGPNVLQHMTSDSDADVRIQVAEARWRLEDDAGLEVLVSGMLSRAPDDVMICLQALVAPKNRIVDEYVRGKLTDDYRPIALVAARCMGELGYDAGYGVAMNSVRSPDPGERSLSATALGYIGRSDAQSALSSLLKDSEPKVRLAAARAILQLKQ